MTISGWPVCFWLACLRAQSRRRTMLVSYCGIGITLSGVAAGLWWGNWRGGATGWVDDWRLIAGCAVAGDFTAWAAHFTVQGNVPVMFQGPKSALWSAASLLRMYVPGHTLRLGPERRHAGIRISEDA